MGSVYEFGILNSEFGISIPSPPTMCDFYGLWKGGRKIRNPKSEIRYSRRIVFLSCTCNISGEEEHPYGNHCLAQPSLKQVQAGGQPAA